MLYNMAIDKNKIDYEFFTKVDNHMNLKLLENKDLDGRYSFGALYAYYNYGIGKPENVIYFERFLAENPMMLCMIFYY